MLDTRGWDPVHPMLEHTRYCVLWMSVTAQQKLKASPRGNRQSVTTLSFLFPPSMSLFGVIMGYHDSNLSCPLSSLTRQNVPVRGPASPAHLAEAGKTAPPLWTSDGLHCLCSFNSISWACTRYQVLFQVLGMKQWAKQLEPTPKWAQSWV